MKLLSFILLLSTVGGCFAAVTNSNEYSLDMNKLDSQCAFYTNQTVIPLIEYIQQLRSTIENNNNTCLMREKEIVELRQNITDLSLSKDKEIIELREKNIRNDAIINGFRNQVYDLPKKCSAIKCDSYINDLSTKSQTIDNLNNQIVNLTIQVQADAVKLAKQRKCEEPKAINNQKSSSCIPYGNDPGIHEIQVSTLPPFEVLCDSQTAGPGWTVIQQRINGEEDFFRDWNTYREGFGSFDGDFFLGLEKIHQMTKFQRHKLYIHMEEFNGRIFNAQYDNFKIAAEADNYRLSSLGKFASNATYDSMRIHENEPFSTFDRDHDSWEDENCAINNHGGWWYYHCAHCNLNGKYLDSEVTDYRSIYWYYVKSLKTVKMLIRPTTN